MLGMTVLHIKVPHCAKKIAFASVLVAVAWLRVAVRRCSTAVQDENAELWKLVGTFGLFLFDSSLQIFRG